MDVAQTSPTVLQVGLEQESDLTELRVSVANSLAGLGQPTFGSLLPQGPGLGRKIVDHARGHRRHIGSTGALSRCRDRRRPAPRPPWSCERRDRASGPRPRWGTRPARRCSAMSGRPSCSNSRSMSLCGESSSRPYPPTATSATPSIDTDLGLEQLTQPLVDEIAVSTAQARLPRDGDRRSTDARSNAFAMPSRMAENRAVAQPSGRFRLRWRRRRARRCGCARCDRRA